jgi:TP53 regulating kinase-like protein
MRLDVIKEKIIRKGAEASLYYGYWFGKEVIFKYRIPKEYRIEELDKKIRMERTLNEARALIRVKKYGINVPQVYEIDISNSTIIMKYIQGNKLKDILSHLTKDQKQKFFFEIGRIIALLHKNGHIHGDITTSNLIITQKGDIFIIDFGLHEYSDTLEDKAVDLHLFKRVLISSHGTDYEFCFKTFLEGYRLEYMKADSLECDKIIQNIEAIATRGRYVKPEERL